MLKYKGIMFDDYVEENDKELTGVRGAYVWTQICADCAKKHHIDTAKLDSGDGICGVKGCENEADYCIDIYDEAKYGAIEVCQHCGKENDIIGWNVETDGYEYVCEQCGEKIMLCSECLDHGDNDELYCDWWEEGKGCFRCTKSR